MAKARITFVSRRIYTGVGRPFAGYVKISDGVIESMGTDLPQADGSEIIDVGDNLVIPGLIDLHVHGAAGSDVVFGDDDSIQHVARFLAANGVTAFQPTSVAAPMKLLDRTIERVRNMCYGPVSGARVLGLHMEGPFLNPLRKGAMDGQYLLPPSLGLIDKWLTLAQGTINQMTIAPELPNALSAIRYLVRKGVTVSAGHTDATFFDMQEAFRAGVTVCTHTFNAMRGFHHREPGALGAVLTQRGIMCEVVADGTHVHPAAIRLLIEAKGLREVLLVSDSILAAGLPEGQYVFSGQPVTVDAHGRCLLSDGTIAGSVATLTKCLQNVVETCGVPLEDALCMVTLNPARVAGVDHRKGTLAVGKDADVVVLDQNYDVLWCIVEGEVQKSPSC